MRHVRIAFVAVLLAACGGDAAGPARPEVAGTYVVTQLAFDPQGVLPQVDVLARLGDDAPRLILAPGGQAQLAFQDPETGLITVANGTYSTPAGAVRIDFGADPAYRTVLLSRRMTFTSAGTGVGATMRFEGTAPDGVSRARLLQLVPEFAGEQLLDPVPGELVVQFTRQQ